MSQNKNRPNASQNINSISLVDLVIKIHRQTNRTKSDIRVTFFPYYQKRKKSFSEVNADQFKNIPDSTKILIRFIEQLFVVA